jgi:hypothetical protein
LEGFEEDFGNSRTVTRTVYTPSKYLKEGETAGQALARLATSLSTVNSVFDTLNITLMQSSIEGANAASTLIDAFGGLDKFGEAIGSYYENFYTEGEKSAKMTETLAKQFTNLGITMPKVDGGMRAWYKTQVESALLLDQSVPANAKYVVSLLGLQATVNELAPSFDDLTAGMEDTAKTAKEIEAERKSLQDEYNQLTMTETELMALKRASLDESNQTLFDNIQLEKEKQAIANEAKGLQDELNQLTMTSAELSALKRASLNEENRALYDSVQAAKAANAAIASFNSAMSSLGSTRFDLENQLLTLQGNEGEVQTRTRERDLAELTKGLSAEDALIVTQTYDYNAGLKQRIKDQQKANDLAVKQAEDAQRAQEAAASAAKQAADDASRAAQQIKDAWKSITDSLFNEIARIKGLLLGENAGGLSDAQQQFSTATTLARAGDQEAAKSLPELSKLVLDLATNQASTLTELRRIQAQTAASLEVTALGLSSAYGLQIPAYASGGSYAGGMALVGEQGPELINFNQGGQVYTANQTAGLLGQSGDLADKFDKLANEVSLLRIEARATAISTSKLNSNFERSIVPTTSGDALLVKTAT